MPQDPWTDDTHPNQAARDGQEARAWPLLAKLVDNVNIEQRRSRRWGILFKSLTFFYLFAALAVFWAASQGLEEGAAGPHVAVIDVLGPIAEGQPAGADALVPALEQAFAEPQAEALILNINSPGGSPVQAGIVFDELMRLRGLHPALPVYAVIGDVGASGAYYMAAASDRIYADKASLVGSIGVISPGFGFTKLMEQVGIERRVYSAGANKNMLDPFSPEQPAAKASFQSLLDQVHGQFIDAVKAGRGERLADQPELFSGQVWNGAEALNLGLVDGLGSLYSVTRELDLEPIWYGPELTPMEQLMEELGAGVGASLAAALGVNSQAPLR